MSVEFITSCVAPSDLLNLGQEKPGPPAALLLIFMNGPAEMRLSLSEEGSEEGAHWVRIGG